MQSQKGSIVNAVFLVAGTCVGGGMLALPVATGVAGFFPSFLMMAIGWAFMTLTALFLLEVNLWMEEGAHVITMADRFLGPIGKAAAWLLYLFIGYASLVAYTAGGGELIVSAVQNLFHVSLNPSLAMTLFVAIFGLVIYLGNIIVGRVNTILVVGMVIAYVLLISLGASHVKWNFLLRREWGHCIISVPLLLTIFSFQTIVPSLTIYLKKDGRALKIAIIAGTTLALIIYMIWQWLVLGSVMIDGEYGLAAALAQGKPATEFLRFSIANPWVSTLAEFFAFFAIVTSFLGIALGLFDFLSDGLKIKKEKWGSVSLGLLVAIPTLFCALTIKKVFLNALDSTGGIGDALLNGMIPALMLWVGRYRDRLSSETRIGGGKPLIILVMLYALFVFLVEILGRLGIVDSLCA